MTHSLFEAITIKNVSIKNRIFMSPMCMYSCDDKSGIVNNFHLIHYGARALGGAGLIICEATAVCPEGRISPYCAGIWSDAHTQAWKPVTAAISSQNCVPVLQIAHAGRKASTNPIRLGSGPLSISEGGWNVVGPSDVPFNDVFNKPHGLSVAEIDNIVQLFVDGAKRAIEAGFQGVEIHGAHGYLIHSFLSPYSNKRTDEYGGSLQNRARFPLRVIEAVRAAIGDKLLLLRISATDWLEESSWNIEEAAEFSKMAEAKGVDFIDVSTGGNVHEAKIAIGPAYQRRFASEIKKVVNVPVGAVGLLNTHALMKETVEQGYADVVMLARPLLTEPNLPLKLAELEGIEVPWPHQYARAKRFWTPLE